MGVVEQPVPEGAVGARPCGQLQAEVSRLQAVDLTCGYNGTPVVEHVNFSLVLGEVCCILGPNGIGKTTLFKTLLGVLPVLGGQVLIDGHDIAQMTRQQIARKVGYVPQAHTPPFPFSVLDVVEMGRTSRVGVFQAPSSHDRDIAFEALNTLGIAHLGERLYTQISGGERQMVLIARALAQQASLLVMDEPTANLDFGNQLDVLSYVKQLARAGLSVLMTTHTPDHVFMCADSVVAVKGRRDVVTGKVGDVMTDSLVEELYGVHAHVTDVSAGEGTVRMVVPELRKGENRRARAIREFLQHLQ